MIYYKFKILKVRKASLKKVIGARFSNLKLPKPDKLLLELLGNCVGKILSICLVVCFFARIFPTAIFSHSLPKSPPTAGIINVEN